MHNGNLVLLRSSRRSRHTRRSQTICLPSAGQVLAHPPPQPAGSGIFRYSGSSRTNPVRTHATFSFTQTLYG
ncbi:hypothetical protein B0H10DRAFT_2096719 [Mycena sp. CBHHK59/15]|nr:hypothetical protein B0H10DRAFT_2096719 [Mycena sp. CBHHK59/15]